ncbi:hypothetical protein L873DRAFT_1795770 [Choiromyces venosus 120613-1]|uniref:Uncharacterized protein n=1 Tax=Choiromyces venosus 120613-1 TaxID=1336337 RepID=A0A3N4IYW2_9PEZI|nr:hypothetical protein L873DRAFT_1795770 [Choiromyces venosus 120613-1]
MVLSTSTFILSFAILATARTVAVERYDVPGRNACRDFGETTDIIGAIIGSKLYLFQDLSTPGFNYNMVIGQVDLAISFSVDDYSATWWRGSETPIGAIVSGAVGGVAAIALAVTGILLWTRRKARQAAPSPEDAGARVELSGDGRAIAEVESREVQRPDEKGGGAVSGGVYDSMPQPPRAELAGQIPYYEMPGSVHVQAPDMFNGESTDHASLMLCLITLRLSFLTGALASAVGVTYSRLTAV